MQNPNRILLAVAAGACFMLAACRSSPERRYELKGKVVSFDKTRRQVTIAHDRIGNYMDAMTMPFNIKDDWALDVLAPGQSIEATLVVKGERSWIEGIRVSQSSAVEGSPASVYEPEIGKEVPDFRLLNQDSKRIHISQYRGRPLLLTFIYTRCPLPDYCPRTSSNFAEVHRGLQSWAEAGRKPHLLTISFDTDFDTPAVLRSYAARYIDFAGFRDWTFATGTPDEIKQITGYFGLMYRHESGQITHSLVTALIAPDGKLARLYRNNVWTPGQVLEDLRREAHVDHGGNGNGLSPDKKV
jgi:protein SCO1/2